MRDLTASDPEIKKNATINAVALDERKDVVEQLIEHYSSWTRLKKAVAWIIKVKDTLLCLAKRR